MTEVERINSMEKLDSLAVSARYDEAAEQIEEAKSMIAEANVKLIRNDVKYCFKELYKTIDDRIDEEREAAYLEQTKALEN